MRDWLLVLLPIGVVIYLLAYPSQFTALVNWMSRLTH
jgi:hypothetical protein